MANGEPMAKVLLNTFCRILIERHGAMKACKCSSTNFSAHQRCYHDIVVNSSNIYKKDNGVYESENPYGPYTCIRCGAVYDDLNELTGTGGHNALENSNEMAFVDKIEQKLHEEKQRLSDLYDQKSAIASEISAINVSLPQLAKEYADELSRFVFRYMRERFGIEDMHDANRSYLIFDKTALFIKVYRIKQDFEYVDDMEKVLKKKKLYGHNASSWFSRSREFYNLDLREQLKVLAWTFDDAGNVTGARW